MRDGDNWGLGNSGEVVIFVIYDEEPVDVLMGARKG